MGPKTKCQGLLEAVLFVLMCYFVVVFGRVCASLDETLACRYKRITRIFVTTPNVTLKVFPGRHVTLGTT